MGIPSSIRDFTQKIMPHFAAGHERYRGQSHPLDIFATGTIRFAKKLGSQLPVLVADNSMMLADRVASLSTSLPVDHLLNWMELGGFVSIAGREIAMITDWDTDGKIIQIDTPTKEFHDVRDMVFFYSAPIEVIGTYTEGATVIIVKTKHILVIGDSVLIDAKLGNRSFVEHRVTKVIMQEDNNLDGLYTWQIVLDRGIVRTISDSEEIQLRAYPAYQSRLLKVPTLPDSSLPLGIGPFLLDWFSGSLVIEQEYEEVMAFQARSLSGDPLMTDTTIASPKNSLVWKVPILASSMLFWDLGLGQMNYGRKYIMPAGIDPPGLTGIGDPNGTLAALGTIYQDKISGVYFRCMSDPAGTVWKKVDMLHTVPMLIAQPNTVESTDPFSGQWFLSQDCVPTITPPQGKFAQGSIKVVPVADLFNYDHFVLPDGISIFTFEYKVDGTYVPSVGVITIDVSSLTTADEVAIATKLAIDGSGLNFTTTTSSALVLITNNTSGSLGNQVIVESVANPKFIVYGMADGADGGIDWALKVYPETTAKIRIRLYPNDWQPVVPSGWWSVTDGVNGEYINVHLDAQDQPVERIDIAIETPAVSTDSNGVVTYGKLWIGDWTIKGSRVASLTYSLMCRVMGSYTWCSSFLLAKPYFQLLDYLRAWRETGDYDHGRLML